jgi:predicted site-specific integrase-resolvase
MIPDQNGSVEFDTDPDFMTPTKFADVFGYDYSTLSVYIRKGDIALHQFTGEKRPKINIDEAIRVMSAVKRPYRSPTLRVIRHDDRTQPVAETKKNDLFG